MTHTPQHDFDYTLLDETAHRPWPVPERPWVMTQTWHDLLFAHWRAGRQLLESRIPDGLELDLYDGEAWVGIVPFHMTNVGPRALPALPWVSAFPELNVRTYVRVRGKPGVFFFSLDASSVVAVEVAGAMFNLPYHVAKMTVEVAGSTVVFRSQRSEGPTENASFTASYQSNGPIFRAEPGSLEYFLTERYCLYTVDRSNRVQRVDIHHLPWKLQRATAAIESNTMASANHLELSHLPPLLHFAKRQDAIAWLPVAAD